MRLIGFQFFHAETQHARQCVMMDACLEHHTQL